jgi:hypothetical protein
MNKAPERNMRFVDAGERHERRSDYWRTRGTAERLQAVLALHREGNALFKGGQPHFVFQWTLTDVHPR